MFLIVIGILILGFILILFQKLKALDNEHILYIGLIILIGSFLVLPLYDPLKMQGFLAIIIMEETRPSLYFIIVGLVIINICLIYGIHIFLSSMNLIYTERYKDRVVYVGFYRKMRHPIFASCNIIGLSYFIIMGSIIGVICFSLVMIFLYFEAIRQEKKILIPKFGEAYQIYKQKVPTIIYNSTIIGLLFICYAAFIIGIVGILAGL